MTSQPATPAGRPGGETAFAAGVGLARLLQEEGRADEAEAVARRLLGQAGEEPDRLRRLGHLFPALGLPQALPGTDGPDAAEGVRDAERRERFDLALGHWQAVLARSPEQLEARLGVVRCLRRDGRLAEAEATAAALARKLQNEPKVLQERARIADDAQDHPQAESRWLAAMAASPGELGSRLGWARCLGRQHRFEEARAALDTLAAARPEAIEPRLALARLALAEGDPKAAAQAFAAALARSPASAEALIGQGRVLELEHRFAAALAHHERLVREFPHHAEVRAAHARAALQQADLEAAHRSWTALLALDPDRPDAWLGLAATRAETGEVEAGLTLLDEATQRWPRHPAMAIERACVLEEAGRPQDARLTLLAARAGLPHRRELRVAMVELERRRRALPEARTLAEEALAEHPRSLDVVLLAADLRLATEGAEAARALLDPLAEVLPRHREVEKRLARLEAIDGRLERARRRWRRIARHNIRVSGPEDAIERLDRWPIPEGRNELRAFVVERNERVRLAWLLDHYRRLGVERFFVLDNGSDDGTLDWLARQPPDLHLFRTHASYAAAGYGLRWTHRLLDEWGEGRWCLVVDADEALVYPHVEHLTLKELTRHLDATGAEALLAPMLDMYAPGPLAACRYEAGESLIERFPWFDPEPYAEEPVPEFPFRRLTGGPRRRCFAAGGGRLAAQMEKVPLVRWRRDIRYISSTHQLFPVRLATETGLLLHFKYLPDFADSVRREAQRREHSVGARRHRRYQRQLEGAAELGLHHPGSLRYQGSRQLVRLGLMRSSAALDAHARSVADRRR